MRDNTLDNKVVVFISSKCDGEYAIVRKALSRMLLETNLFSPYIFELQVATSQDATTTFTTKLDTSDLCIFLIDNKDGVSDGVLIEHQRAIELNKKCIYIFCDQREKEPTTLQKELKLHSRQKYKVISDFSDFVPVAYESALRDIMNIYQQYCYGTLVVNPEPQEIDQDLSKMDSYKFDKKFLAGIDLTKSVLSRIFGRVEEKETLESSETDILSSKFLNHILGNTKELDIDFETAIFSFYKIHDKYLHKLLKHRLKAIEYYFSNDLNACLSEIEKAYNESTKLKKIPGWLSNDIALDLRNVQFLIEAQENQRSSENRGQKLLNENNESLYFPLIDRFESSINSSIFKNYFRINTESPYATHYGIADDILSKNASVFYISFIYCSLTHMITFPETLSRTLSSLFFEYRDQKTYVELIKCLILMQKAKDIESLVNTYDETTDSINHTDLEKILRAIASLSIPHERISSLLLVVRFFGYYLSSEQFEEVLSQIDSYIVDWLDDNDRTNAIGKLYYDAIERVLHRISINRVLYITYEFIGRGFSRWFDDILRIISKIDFRKVPVHDQKRIANFLSMIVGDLKLREHCRHLNKAIIKAHHTMTISLLDLDQLIEKEMPSFFRTEFDLELRSETLEGSVNHIRRYIETIKERNRKQGVNGTYFGYGDNPYITIRNIIDYNKLDLDQTTVGEIIAASRETLLAINQGISAKNSAIQLLIFLKNRLPNDMNWDGFCEECMARYQEIITGYNEILVKDSVQTLDFNLMLLRLSFQKCDFGDLIKFLSKSNRFTDNEIIQAVAHLETLLFNIDFDLISESVLAVIMQYVSSLSSHTIREVRLLTLDCLISLTRSQLRELAIERLSQLFDEGTSSMKIAILYRTSGDDFADSETINYIRQKGLIDSHFLVKQTAKNIVDTMQISPNKS